MKDTNILNKKINDLEFFINNNSISVNNLYLHYNKKLVKSDYNTKLCAKPMTDNLKHIKTLSETIKTLLNEIKQEIKIIN